MKTEKRSSVIVVAMATAALCGGCSAKVEGIGGTGNDRNFLTPVRDLLSEIQGTWHTECANAAQSSSIKELKIQGSLVQMGEVTYTETNCAGSSSSALVNVNFIVGNSSATVSGAYDLDIDVGGFRAPSLIMLESDRLYLGEDSVDGVTRPAKLKTDLPFHRIAEAKVKS